MIKPCNKGAGSIILDFDDYLQSCYQHLSSEQLQIGGSKKPYYEKLIMHH